MPSTLLRRYLLVPLAALPILLAGCQTVDTYFPLVTQFGVYRLDINQGNYLSQDMIDKLKVGQSRQQVRGILGTALVTSAFRDNRWDYIYIFARAGRVREHRQFTVFFNGDALARWEGDEMPQSVADLNRDAASKTLPADPYGEDGGIIGKIIDYVKKL